VIPGNDAVAHLWRARLHWKVKGPNDMRILSVSFLHANSPYDS
jgi:hypothetical protein